MTNKPSRPTRPATAGKTKAGTRTVDSLRDPLILPNGQVLPNRIMKAAMSEAMADKHNAPDHRLVQLYRTWAEGGYGLVITGHVMVDRRQLGEPGNVVIEDERDLESLTRWAAATRDAGIPTWVQLNHPGRQSNLLALGHTPVAPSPVALNLPGAATPRELTGAEIEEIIDRFATAAAVCEKAGFAGVQIHGAHGYLVSQFLSPLTNQRTDEWGGDAERRMRFVLEVVRRVRARVSADFGVGIKLNSADFQRGGFSEEESRGVVAALAKEGIDLFEVSGGSYESLAMSGSAAASTRAREAYFLEYAGTVRNLVGDIPVAVTGGFRSRAAMEQAVGAGECDVIGIAGRPRRPLTPRTCSSPAVRTSWSPASCATGCAGSSARSPISRHSTDCSTWGGTRTRCTAWVPGSRPTRSAVASFRRSRSCGVAVGCPSVPSAGIDAKGVTAIARSRCLVGWWLFSARLFRLLRERCSTEGMTSRWAAP
ncbi:NADH:flavin oxidoreductase/NADH oxidase family protein [Streptomyces scabiei]|uniref:NADH:flavin oxidoreductase/NADH oxidase family protein n=1 Tax=Streptomyces scabiei TaxID=1930 RepID=UPI000B08F11E|nr:NADH:flavin oxidoreductase/NADH oxidase family protein [Streptomyces scabiei]